jgi:TetR/AcrR family transcriptional regulator, lmrAB and yxaGH operons repressor
MIPVIVTVAGYYDMRHNPCLMSRQCGIRSGGKAQMTSDTRSKMVLGTALLLAQRGLHETSFSQVLESTGSPRGSIYYHFPNGKEQLVAEAVDLAGAHALEVMKEVDGSSAREVVDHFIGLWRKLLQHSDLQIGCSVVAVTVATDSAELLSHAGEVFRSWRVQIAELLETGGLNSPDAERFSVTLIAGMEGAVVVSRAERTIEPFELVAEQLTTDVDDLLAKGPT